MTWQTATDQGRRARQSIQPPNTRSRQTPHETLVHIPVVCVRQASPCKEEVSWPPAENRVLRGFGVTRAAKRTQGLNRLRE